MRISTMFKIAVGVLYVPLFTLLGVWLEKAQMMTTPFEGALYGVISLSVIWALFTIIGDEL